MKNLPVPMLELIQINAAAWAICLGTWPTFAKLASLLHALRHFTSIQTRRDDIYTSAAGLQSKSWRPWRIECCLRTTLCCLKPLGNAQTLRNDNSSRFGKFIQINLNTTTGSIYCRCSHSELPAGKRRELQPRRYRGRTQRNSHIFYQLFAVAASPDLIC